jgi:hypothetical protein
MKSGKFKVQPSRYIHLKINDRGLAQDIVDCRDSRDIQEIDASNGTRADRVAVYRLIGIRKSNPKRGGRKYGS